jgi:hypothetical protein
VPFIPDGSRPLYCRSCFAKIKEERKGKPIWDKSFWSYHRRTS